MALSVNDEIKHLELMHKGLSIDYKCTKCQKRYKTKHGALCHLPKCAGPKQPDAIGQKKCTSYSKTFKTKSGLSQHERHEHPLVRNAHRAAEATQIATRPKPKGFGVVWTKEEMEIMHTLEKELQGDKRIASKMCKHLPNKTNKQIRDKRAQQTYKHLVQAILSVDFPEQGANAEADPARDTRGGGG
jgi:hypothetical protein